MRAIGTLLVLILAQVVGAQSIQSFNENWSFSKGTDTLNQGWSSVQLPHTWNAADPFDKEAGYYRGVSWYKKEFSIASSIGNTRYLVFEGANQEVEVYVNGILAGTHLGGYTAFNIEITDLIKAGENQLAVKVDNKHDDRVPPLRGDFNFYGGIYRDVWLHELDEVHFDLSEYGDQGIFITTPAVSKEQATVSVRANINNQASEKRQIVVTHVLYDDQDQVVSQIEEKLRLGLGIQTIEVQLPSLKDPKLWHPNSPTRYRLQSLIKTKSGQVLDQQSNTVGFRWFRFDADEGFFLNDEYVKLIGTNRHQDYEGLGNALSDDRHLVDVTAIKEMGSNFFRTAHYPPDPAVINTADQLGLVVSMEIPLDHDITDSKEFLDNSKRMMQEMIRQNFNHPSIFVWAYMNEMMLGRQWERDQEIIEKIRLQALELEALTRQEDPTRYTMIPNHGALDLYIKAGLTEIPMIVGWNLYYGWYEADGEGAGKFLDRFHELVPDKPTLITEYGAGADPRIRSLFPERFDFSIEWQNQFHQSNLIQFMDRKFLAGAAIWNIADFGSEGRDDADPKINSKGVLAMDRTPKDAYYLYQSWLRKDPIVKIGSSSWKDRTMRSQGNQTPTHPIEVYSNADAAELFLNGKSLGERKVVDHIAKWEVPFAEGRNKLKAQISVADATYTDDTEITVALIKPGKVDWEKGININCGTTFHFIDEGNGVTWLPDLPYEAGLWGYTSGELHRPRDRGIGSDRTIQATQIDPVYQTIRVAPKRYSFDVTTGTYEVVLHWAEVDQKYKDGDEKRIFNVSINQETVISSLDVNEASAFSTAFSKKVRITQSNGPMNIDFESIEGAPMISAIQIRKLN